MNHHTLMNLRASLKGEPDKQTACSNLSELLKAKGRKEWPGQELYVKERMARNVETLESVAYREAKGG